MKLIDSLRRVVEPVKRAAGWSVLAGALVFVLFDIAVRVIAGWYKVLGWSYGLRNDPGGSSFVDFFMAATVLFGVCFFGVVAGAWTVFLMVRMSRSNCKRENI
jgi:hypothetical protein